MRQRVSEFFQKYAVAMQDRELKLLKSIYRLPFIIVHDEPERVVSFDAELETNLKKVLESFDQRAITNIEVEVKKAIRLSNDIHFANVNWTFKNEQGEIQLSYNTSYMLSILEDTIKVITVIIDDENDTYLKLL
ncbi:hypothetical protein GCM10008107_26010 [Psychrosphaera saromensis]|uniref:SnoaL-like domain-containing protein n=1 Tax=Psychrosphaera saromensis TaxID=716813 RepID=A0A2S7UXH1_9GAMM|nr:hypothetical protein [Psychrosphaera saromensis]PQJ54192.1 hypothetical protein BTO11_11375 [Psychrosphaera saromensis]GHB75202.1 hypothetical protein GCM10008107_26010 [Psychrosphaera saromensis]GLQ12713.1 hypothetical protein GCM10007917_01680 [Psychrosphaera saromensis]